MTFRRVVVSLRGPVQSPVLPSACCVGSLRSVGRCGRCSCWCRFHVQCPPPGTLQQGTATQTCGRHRALPHDCFSFQLGASLWNCRMEEQETLPGPEFQNTLGAWFTIVFNKLFGGLEPGGAVMKEKKNRSVQYALQWRPVCNRWRLVCNRWRLVCNRWRLVGSHRTSESGCHS